MKRSNVIMFPVRGVNNASADVVYARMSRAVDSKQYEKQLFFLREYFARLGIKFNRGFETKGKGPHPVVKRSSNVIRFTLRSIDETLMPTVISDLAPAAAVYIYCAVEDERQWLKQYSVCERYCARTGLRLGKLYRDAGKVRPSLIQMIEDTRKGVFDQLVVADIVRLGRGYLTLMSRLESLSASGVMVTAVH